MSVADIIQYILEKHYPCETFKEALSLRLVCKRASKVISAKPVKSVFWINCMERFEHKYNIPQGTWLRLNKYVHYHHCNFLDIIYYYFKYLQISNVDIYQSFKFTINSRIFVLTRNNGVIFHNLSSGEKYIEVGDSTMLSYKRVRADPTHVHKHYRTNHNFVACLYEGHLSLTCTHLFITGRHLTKYFDMKPGPRYKVILEYMSNAKKQGLIQPYTRQAELEYLREHLHEIK